MYQYDVVFNLHLLCTVAPGGAEFYKQALLASLTSSIQTALERKLHLLYKALAHKGLNAGNHHKYTRFI